MKPTKKGSMNQIEKNLEERFYDFLIKTEKITYNNKGIHATNAVTIDNIVEWWKKALTKALQDTREEAYKQARKDINQQYVDKLYGKKLSIKNKKCLE